VAGTGCGIAGAAQWPPSPPLLPLPPPRLPLLPPPALLPLPPSPLLSPLLVLLVLQVHPCIGAFIRQSSRAADEVSRHLSGRKMTYVFGALPAAGEPSLMH
jgi:hypothetical protein